MLLEVKLSTFLVRPRNPFLTVISVSAILTGTYAPNVVNVKRGKAMSRPTIQRQIQNLVNKISCSEELNQIKFGHVEFVIRDGRIYNVLFVHSMLVKPEPEKDCHASI